MSRKIAAISTALTVLLLSSGVVVGADGEGNRPEWRVGDYWEYDGWQSQLPVPGRYVHRIEVGAVEPLNVSGDLYDTYRVEDTWTFPSSGTTQHRTWVETGSLSVVKAEDILPVMFLSFSCPYGYCYSTYDPPISVYQFPLHVGKRWSVTSSMTVDVGFGPTTDAFAIRMRVSSEADVRAVLNVSGQTVTRQFRTFAIGVESFQVGSNVTAFSPFGLLIYYAEEVGLWVKAIQYFEHGAVAGEYNLTAFSYTAPAGGIPWHVVLIGVVLVGTALTLTLLLRRRRRGVVPGSLER